MSEQQGDSSTVPSCEMNWPLHKISEPHELNDVLLSAPEDNTTKSNTNTAKESQNEPPIPWRSIELGSPRGQRVSLKGNQRFFDLLLQHKQDYETRAKMEKPLVAVQVLQIWRNQQPPGRFLTVESDTNPPLWKDIGDKKARSKISKSLKHLTTNLASEEPQESTLTTAHTTTQPEGSVLGSNPSSAIVNFISSPCNHGSTRDIVSESQAKNAATPEESKFSSEEMSPSTVRGVSRIKLQITQPLGKYPLIQSGTTKDANAVGELPPLKVNDSLKPPRLPARYQKPEKYARRISEQLYSVKEDGFIYGRWTERDRLMTIYKRQKNHSPEVDLVLISGELGVGKTSLAKTLKNPLTENDYEYDSVEEEEEEWPFFLQGKFEYSSWRDPNAFFVSIVDDFCKQLLDRHDTPLTRKYRNALVDTMKDDILLLSSLVPALANLVRRPHGRKDSCGSIDRSNTSESTGEDRSQENAFVCMATQRIKDVFGKFLAVIASVDPKKHSIIVSLDDLHWASESAMEVFTSLVTNRSIRGVLFLATFRDDCCKNDGHFAKARKRWDQCNHLNVTNLHLENLKKDSVNLMLTDALSLPEEQTSALSSLVFKLTKGNPTFITELLRMLQDKGLLRFDDGTQQWLCSNLQQFPEEIGEIHGLPDLFIAKLLDLPPAILETLKITACLNALEVDESILKMIDTVGSVSSHLKYAAMKGFLKYRKGEYEWASDGVKQATYNLIPVAERSSYHVKIGRRLWLHLEANENPSFYALLMGQIFMGDDKIKEDQDRRAVAALCLQAARRAAKHVGFQTAWLCLSHGISIVSAQKTWGKENYDLSLGLYNTAIEVCYCNGEFSELQSLIDEVLEYARTFEDSLLARCTQIYFWGSRNKQMEAIRFGLETLKQLGENFPTLHPSSLRVHVQARRLKARLRRISDEDMLALPRMRDPKKIASLQIMNHMILYAIFATPHLSAILAFRMVELVLEGGLSAMASVAFAVYGTMLCRYDEIDDGYRYGKLSLTLWDKFKQPVWLGRTYAAYYGSVHSRKRPVHEVLGPLQTAIRTAMQTGDVEFAMLNASLYVFNSSKSLPLPELETEIVEVLGQAEFFGQSLSAAMLNPCRQLALNLMEKGSADPKILQGKLAIDPEEMHPMTTLWARLYQMKLAYLFGDYDLAAQFLDAAPKLYLHSTGAMDFVFALTHECLTLLALARQNKRRLRRILYVRRRLKRLKYWASHSPRNFLGNQYLVAGELASVSGNHAKAISTFSSSILHCRESGFWLEEALANEKLGRHYLEEMKDEESAIPFLKEARRVYEKMGAIALVKHLDSQYSDLIVGPEATSSYPDRCNESLKAR